MTTERIKLTGEGVGTTESGIEAVDDVTMLRVRAMTQRTNNIIDKALIIEREIGMETLYTLLALGRNMSEVSEAVGVDEGEMEFIMCRSSQHRNKFIASGLFDTARASIKVMQSYGNTVSEDTDKGVWLETEQNNALKYHKSVVESYLTVSREAREDTSAVTVNNTIVVGSKDDTPPLPPELESVLDGEFEEC